MFVLLVRLYIFGCSGVCQVYRVLVVYLCGIY